MPKLPVVSGREVVSALQRGGFEIERQRGSHIVMIHRARERVAVVPVHGSKDLLAGTLRGILRQADVSADDLRRLLGRKR